MQLSEKLTQLRLKKELSQEELAEKLGVPAETISNWEKGTAVPKERELTGLSEILGVTTQELAEAGGLMQLNGYKPNGVKKMGFKHFITKKNLIFASAILAALVVAALAVSFSLAPGGEITAGGAVDSSQTSLSGYSSASRDSSAGAGKSSSESKTESSKSSAGAVSSKVTAGNVPSKPQGCEHTYVDEIKRPTCSSQGYTTHTCTKCGKSYTDSYTAPCHSYDKYFCDFCGQPDPSNPYHSLCAWMSTKAPFNDLVWGYNLVYENGSGQYLITYYESSDMLVFYYYGENDILSAVVQEQGMCSLSYYSQGMRGSAELKKAAVSSSYPLELDSYELSMEPWCTEAEFVEIFRSKIDNMMLTIQDKLLYPNTKFKLKTLGFTAYQ